MTQTDTGATLNKLRKMIQTLQKEEMVQMQRTHSDALAQIVSIARQHDLTAEHITFALNVRQPKEKKIRVPRKNKRGAGTASDAEVMQ
jgi:hypothetical protein